jgi:hypothetical protein
MVGVNGNAAHRADLDTLRLVEMPHALGALGRIDLVDLLAHVDRLVRAFGFADIAVDALVGDHQSHGVLPVISEQAKALLMARPAPEA